MDKLEIKKNRSRTEINKIGIDKIRADRIEVNKIKVIKRLIFRFNII